MNSKFLQAVVLLSGMIIGVGMFGIPFVFSRVGFFAGLLEMIMLTAVVTLFHLMYGEVVLRTNAPHRLPGYAGLYLGGFAKALSTISYVIGIYGAMLAYIIVGGTFLAGVLGISPLWGAILFFAAGAVLVLGNITLEAEANYILTVLMVLVIMLVSALALFHFQPQHIFTFQPQHLFLPYGVLLFSLSGAVVIPAIAEFLGDRRPLLRKVITGGSVIPFFVYTLFALGVVGASGQATSEEAVTGLLPFLGSKVIFLGNLMGLLTTFTSFFLIASAFEEMLKDDFGFKKIPSWLLTMTVPLALFLFGLRGFIGVIGFVGAVAIGIDSLLLILLFRAAKKWGDRIPEYSLSIPAAILIILALVFLGGIGYEIFS